jgi:hypothetical protein
MPRIGKNEPSFEAEIVGRYFKRFTTIIVDDSANGKPRKEIRVNGVEVASKDADYDYISRKVGKTIKWCSLRTLDRILVRFHLNLSDFEIYYAEQNGTIKNDLACS